MSKFLYAIFFLLLLGCSSSKNAGVSNSIALSEAHETELKMEFLKANREKILGNGEEALRLFRRCLMLNPNHAASLYEAGRIEYYLGQSLVAIAHMEKAVAIDPENKWYKLELAEMYTASGQYTKAAALYEALSIQFKYNPEWKRQEALMYVAAGEYKTALKKYSEFEDFFGVSEEVSIQKQKIYLEQNDLKKAIEEMKKLILSFPEESKYLAILAELYKKDKNDEAAIATFKELEKKSPNNPYVQLSLSEYYAGVGRIEESYNSLKKAFENTELDIDTKIRYLLKYYAISGGDTTLQKQAEELNMIVIAVHPDDPKSHAMLGDFLYRDGKLEEARVSYIKALDLDKSRFAIWNQLMIIDSELEDFEAMIAHAHEAIELFPNQALFYYFKSIAHIQKEEYEKAIYELETGLPMAILNKDLSIQFHSSLGDSYHFSEQYEKSNASYEAALELDPHNFYVLNNYSYFLSLRKEQLEKAEKMSKKCVLANPDSPTYLDTHAWVLYQSGKYEEAKKYLDLAITHGGGSSGEILEHYGDVLYRLGEKDEALKYWQQAQAAGQDSEELVKKIESGTLE